MKLEIEANKDINDIIVFTLAFVLISKFFVLWQMPLMT